MGWWTKIFKGPGHRGHGRYGANTHLEEPQNSMVFLAVSFLPTLGFFTFKKKFGPFSCNLIRRSLCPTRFAKLQDDLTDTEREEIDCAIALSLSEEDQKGKKVVGKIGL